MRFKMRCRGIGLRGRFTRWYWRNGYRYDFKTGESKCPRHVRPFRFLLSPSVYHSLSVADAFVAGWVEGLTSTLAKIGGSLENLDSRMPPLPDALEDTE